MTVSHAVIVAVAILLAAYFVRDVAVVWEWA